MNKRIRLVYGALFAVWGMILVWQAVEHARVQEAAQVALRNRAKDISTTLGIVLRSQRRFGGMISKVKFTITRRTNEKMAIVTLEDLAGSVEALVFPATFSKVSNMIKQDAIVFVKGRLSLREEEPKIIVNEIAALDSVRLKYTKAVLVDLVTMGLDTGTLEKLKKVLSRYPGRIPVYLRFVKPDKKKTVVSIGNTLCVEPHEGLIRDIEKLFGADVVSFKA